jgi:hypothetical protein
MDHFDIDIEYRGSTKTFQGTFSKYGWSYRFTVDVDGCEVIFEPDEERNLRAIVPAAKQHDTKTREIVKLIGEELGRAL